MAAVGFLTVLGNHWYEIRLSFPSSVFVGMQVATEASEPIAVINKWCVTLMNTLNCKSAKLRTVFACFRRYNAEDSSILLPVCIFYYIYITYYPFILLSLWLSWAATVYLILKLKVHCCCDLLTWYPTLSDLFYLSVDLMNSVSPLHPWKLKYRSWC